MSDNKDELIERLIAIRAETGLLSKDFATKAGIDPRNYSSIESGKRPIGDRVMKDICQAFNINLMWLKTGKGEKYVSSVQSVTDNIMMPREVFDQMVRMTETMASQQQTMAAQQRTIEKLVDGQKGVANLEERDAVAK